MKKYLFLLISLFPIYAAAINFKHLGMKEGLSQLSVMSIYQDELGRMWFGTMEGLSVYDGIHIISFKPAERALAEDHTRLHLLGNVNFPLDGDGRGSLYVVSDNALLRYDFRSEQFESLIKNNVETVFVHKKNSDIWVGIADSVCRWNPIQHRPEFLLNVQGHSIQKIFIDSRNYLWIGTQKGLYRSTDRRSIELMIPGEDIYQLYEDSKSNLWVATREKGMYQLDKRDRIQKFTQIAGNPNSLASDQVRDFVEDNEGNLWIGTFRGLNRYDPHTDRFILHQQDSKPGSLLHSSIFSICKDRQGSIWLGTYYGGVHFFNPEADIFTLFSANQNRKDCLSFPFVGHMVEDSDHNLWICTEGGGLNLYDRKTGEFTHFLANNVSSIAHNNLKDICYSRKRNKLYIGTHMGGLSIYDISQKTFRNPNLVVPSFRSKSGDVINQLFLYQDNILFMLTRNGIIKMDLDTEQITPLFDSNTVYNGICFMIDSKDRIWIASEYTVVFINLKNEEDKKIYRYGENGLGRSMVSKIFEDRNGQIFFGTGGSGLFVLDQKTNTFKGYNVEKDFLLSNYCYDIVQTPEGHLILSSDKGLSFFDPHGKTIKVIDLGTALPISGINIGCGMLVCANGEIFVGGVDGATSFFEYDFPAAVKDYRLYFSELSINNRPVYPEKEKGVIPQAIPYVDEIKLKHNQNNLVLTFASDNYVSVLKQIVYEYRLFGFDDKWIKGTDNHISYTNLNPGEYTLVVREKPFDSKVTPRSIEMSIVIKSPLYATPLAYLFYIVFVLLIVYRFYRYQRSQLRLVTSLAFERKEKESIEKLNQTKLQFFSNISHEFRTPLILIIAQIELLLQKSSLTPSTYNKLVRVHKNASLLQDLVTELLTFRKLEQGHVRLKVVEHELVGFVREIYDSFLELAKKVSIEFLFHPRQEEVYCWFDGLQMQKVFFNLLSNAFKNTAAKGCIEIIIGAEDEEVWVKVIDNGTGICREDTDRIFERFYQADNPVNNSLYTVGTGIGLALSKSIIELHHGNISVESAPGYGSIFTVRMPKDKFSFSEEELAVETVEPNFGQSGTLPEPLAFAKDEESSNWMEEERPHILIVEDNEELLTILLSLFTPTYRVATAHNGKEGLQKALEECPDIILSDVRMPEMSGIEMCMQLKSNFDVCHIPVVLLTAFASVEQNIEGLQRGADDYIGKPFNTKLLIARCNNMIRNRIVLRKKFTHQRDFDSNLLATNPIDQHFLNEVDGILDRNLDNVKFEMNDLARELGISRSSLFVKFKALAGMTPNDFVLYYRLKRASILLKSNPELQIAEIAYRSGFNSPRYFSHCFKAKFSVTPVEYRKKTDS